MADTIVAQITSEIKTTLDGMTSYGGTVTSSLERYYNHINDRYPYLEILGPYAIVETETDDVMDTVIQYAFKYYIKYNDEEFADVEVAKVVENVVRDITKQIMADQQRSGLAENTEITESGISFEEIDGEVDFCVYVICEVQTIIDGSDPYLLG